MSDALAACVDCGESFEPAFEGDCRCGACFVAEFESWLAAYMARTEEAA